MAAQRNILQSSNSLVPATLDICPNAPYKVCLVQMPARAGVLYWMLPALLTAKSVSHSMQQLSFVASTPAARLNFSAVDEDSINFFIVKSLVVPAIPVIAGVGVVVLTLLAFLIWRLMRYVCIACCMARGTKDPYSVLSGRKMKACKVTEEAGAANWLPWQPHTHFSPVCCLLGRATEIWGTGQTMLLLEPSTKLYIIIWSC